MNAIKSYQKAIPHKRYGRNGAYPDAAFLGRLIRGQNHAMAYRRKTFARWGDMDSPMVATSASTARYRFRCHTGYGATHIGFVIASGLDDKQTVDPIITINVTIAGGATTTEVIHTGANSAVATDAPSELSWRTVQVAATGNTAYEVEILTEDYARVMAFTAYEIASPVVDGTVDFYAEIEPGVGFPVYDSTRQDLLEGMSKMWRKNGSHLYSFMGAGDGVAIDYTTTTWTNVIDGATSSTAATAGIQLPTLENRCRQSDDTTIDVVLAVYGSCTTAAVGEVRLYDTTAAASVCSLTGIGTAAAWYTTTTTIASVDTLGKLDIQARVSATPRTFSLYAVSLFALA